MAVDLIGKENVKKYIIRGGRPDFTVKRYGAGPAAAPIFESLNNGTPKDAADVFDEWADMVNNDGGNVQIYEICIFHKSEDAHKNKALKSQFQLSESSGRNKTRGEHGEIIINNPAVSSPGKMGMSKVDVDKLISEAVEKVQTNHLIQLLMKQN